MKRSNHLTPGEFELMEILWPLGEASVRNVWERVDPGRGLAYTTVMTVLEKMYRKGILAQRKKGKAYLYSAILGRDEALKGIFEYIRNAYFAGSYPEFVAFVNRHCAPVAANPTGPAPAEASETAEEHK
jgi:predicted transcriptional regulator